MKKWDTSRVMRVLANYIFPLVLLLYPLRHIHWGLDLWDTGYNYANFRFMGLEHMDSMWFFSTYLANAVGHILSLLPGGDTLLFMNLYTGLFVSALALLAYWFCVKRVKLPAFTAFFGVFVAVSLCWCPTALLYNYLTYVLYLLAVIFLYEGLTKEKNLYLVFAGICLGTNVFVRFSNLPEAAMIVAVWAYAIICKKKFKKVAQETGWCFLGYAGAIVAWLLFLSLRYGFSDYVAGITRLFSMTDTATDYKASSMLYGIFLGYKTNLYWFNRLLVFMVLGIVICTFLPKMWKKVKWALCGLIAVVAAGWLYYREFCNLHFNEYNAMLLPGIIFMMITLLTCGGRILQKNVEKEEKLLAGMIMLQILLTPIGSNNALFPAINNLFLAVPYMLGTVWKLCRNVSNVRIAKAFEIELIPVKTMLCMFFALFMFQSIGFGTGFVFVEAAGAKKVDTKVENNDILKGMYMEAERAEWLSEISAYAAEEELFGQEVVLYGNIPALSFYLDMPSAFNPWSDLRSYSFDSMSRAIDELEAEIQEGKNPPVVIVEKKFVIYLLGGEEALREAGYPQTEIDKALADEKIYLIADYMEKYDYEETFANNKFVLYETEKRAYD